MGSSHGREKAGEREFNTVLLTAGVKLRPNGASGQALERPQAVQPLHCHTELQSELMLLNTRAGPKKPHRTAAALQKNRPDTLTTRSDPPVLIQDT
ncbi:hypothetical protein MHYP_G00017940 [Metynnis hypsauchen]